MQQQRVNFCEVKDGDFVFTVQGLVWAEAILNQICSG